MFDILLADQNNEREDLEERPRKFRKDLLLLIKKNFTICLFPCVQILISF